MTARSRQQAPIAAQVLALLAGGLIAAQFATLVLSALLPPPPTPQYPLADIAAALRGGALRGAGLAPLERAIQAAAPDSRSPGWQVAEPSQHALAAMLGVDPTNVRLLFYSPPPFAGMGRKQANAAPSHPRIVEASLLAPLLLAPPPGPGGGPGAGGWSGGPGGPAGGGPGEPGGVVAEQGPQASGGGGRARGGPDPNPGGGARGGYAGAPGGSAQVFDAPLTPVTHGAPDAGPSGADPGRSGLGEAGQGRAAIARAPSPDGPIQTAPRSALPMGPLTGAPPVPRPAPVLATPSPADMATASAEPDPGSAQRQSARSGPSPTQAISAPAAGSTGAALASLPRLDASPQARENAQAGVAEAKGAAPLAPPVESTLFGLARTPMVDGEFLAALRVAPGRWVTVRPLQAPLFSRWQRRLALWFLLAFAAVAPVGYLLARRLAAPLAALADNADQLGRDPSTPVIAIHGAPEVRRLALALAGMQTRLQRHVADRTAMVGAVSHDLRTPLARLRFKLERAPPALKASMLSDLGQMEEMLNAVLLFIRDASEPGPRELADLRSIVECVVDDAALVGGEATLAAGDPAPVQVDILSVQRVLTNLVDNALKYGGSAQLSLSTVAGEAVVRIADAGPGLDAAERDKVFQPFYRSEAGRRASAQGMGLGLSVSRSIARAHGGDIVLRAGEPGLIAELRLPLALAVSPRRDHSDALAPAA